MLRVEPLMDPLFDPATDWKLDFCFEWGNLPSEVWELFRARGGHSAWVGGLGCRRVMFKIFFFKNFRSRRGWSRLEFLNCLYLSA
jgi:hypothetical protein